MGDAEEDRVEESATGDVVHLLEFFANEGGDVATAVVEDIGDVFEDDDQGSEALDEAQILRIKRGAVQPIRFSVGLRT